MLRVFGFWASDVLIFTWANFPFVPDSFKLQGILRKGPQTSEDYELRAVVLMSRVFRL
jgi:hypothetical protein